jgi:hypothetical protein
MASRPSKNSEIYQLVEVFANRKFRLETVARSKTAAHGNSRIQADENLTIPRDLSEVLAR